MGREAQDRSFSPAKSLETDQAGINRLQTCPRIPPPQGSPQVRKGSEDPGLAHLVV